MFDVVFTKVILSHRIFTAHFRDTHRSGSVSACKHLYDMYKFVFVHVRMCEVEWGLCVHWVCRTNWTWLLFLEVPVYFCFFVVFFLFFQNISFFLFFFRCQFLKLFELKVCLCVFAYVVCMCLWIYMHACVCALALHQFLIVRMRDFMAPTGYLAQSSRIERLRACVVSGCVLKPGERLLKNGI